MAAAAAGAAVALGGGCSTLLKAPAPSAGNSEVTTKRGGARGASPRPSGKSDDRGACPDLSDPATVRQTDWSADFLLGPEESKTLTTALAAAAGIQSLSAKLDSDVRAACAGIVRDLGVKSDNDSAEALCAAAVRGIGEARARLGSKTRFHVAVVAP